MPDTPQKRDRKALQLARRRKQEKYWNDRAQSRVRVNDRNADQVKAEQERAYRIARDKVRKEVDAFFVKFGGVAGITPEEARLKLSRKELKDFQAELERKRKIIQGMIAADPENKRLKRYDTEWQKLSKVRELTRKEALETNISAEIAQLGGKQQMSMDAHINQVINTGLKMNADDLHKLGDFDAKLGVGSPAQVKRAARENWQHSDFSARIWADKEKLIKETRDVIEEGFARHKGAMDLGTDLMTRMNCSHANALRVVRTEFNHLSNQASLAEYKAKGIKKYKFVAAIDNRTCDICHDLNGQIFNVADARVGFNFPPIHPNCRSVTVPVIEWGDDDEWDYSGIELDDDELKALGLDDDDVKALDASAPKLPKDAPAPSLSVQDANQAANDTQSVIRRSELREQLERQTLELDAAIHKELDRIDSVNDDLKRLEDINKRMDAVGAEFTPTRAAIEAENLEQIHIDIQERELATLKLQTRAARLDDSVPKPNAEHVDVLTNNVSKAKDAREKRRKQELPMLEIVTKAMPAPFDVPEDKAIDALVPQSKIGRLWKRFVDKVNELKGKLNEWVVELGLKATSRLGITARKLPSGATIVDLFGRDRVRAKKHAELYYEEIRHKTNDVEKIALNTGFSVDEIQRIKNYLFMDVHDLEENGIRRFYPDFSIAQSWQRLELGTNIQPHDLTLLRHEVYERMLMDERGMSQTEAHTEACRKFNYTNEAEAYYDTLKKHKENRNIDRS